MAAKWQPVSGGINSLFRTAGSACLVVLLAASLAFAQQDAAAQEPLPDAPSAKQDPQNIPPPALPDVGPTSGAKPTAAADDGVAPTGSTRQAPTAPVRPEGDSGRDEFVIRITPTEIVVPVTVRDSDNRLVEGLQKQDFQVLEDGEERPIRYFTSEPFPLSAAVVVDTGMSEIVMNKLNETLPNIAGAFSAFDEVAYYTYNTHVNKELNFTTGVDRILSGVKRNLKKGRPGNVPVAGGPLGQASPTVNGRPVDPGVPRYGTPRRESRVMHDAVMQAALDLSKRDRGHRKIIFLISDGTEEGSSVGYGEVRRLLLSHEITVYAVGVDAAAIPGYKTLQGMRVPLISAGNYLARYASDTGGEMFAEFTRGAIEQVYASITETARNQYTLAYAAPRRPGQPSTGFREIEVRVKRPNLRVQARNGYYPLPQRQASGSTDTTPK